MEKKELPKINERYEYQMLLLSVREIVKKNTNYCILELLPGKEERKIEAKIWNTKKQDIVSETPEMTVVKLALSGNEYEGRVSYIADSIEPGEGSPLDYLPTSKIPGEKMFDYTLNIIRSHCGSHPMADTAAGLYEENREKLIYYPGALTVHHAYIGGLILHMGTCVNLCRKIAAVTNPSFVKGVMSKSTKEIMNASYKVIGKMAKGPAADTAKSIFRTFSCTHHEEAVEKYITLAVLKSLAGSYPFVNKDLMFAAAAVRKVSVFTDDPMAGVIGVETADMMIAERFLPGGPLDAETARLFRHCLISGMESDRKAAIPEAFLIMYAEKIAECAVKNADAEDLDVESMIIAAALHDIGKIKELDAQPLGKTEYSVNGNMFGHTALGLGMIINAAKEVPEDPRKNKILNCIAAHHGKAEWGALASPASLEAELVFYIDHIDSRMDIYENCAKGLPAGGKDESVRKYIGNVVYRPLDAADKTEP